MKTFSFLLCIFLGGHLSAQLSFNHELEMVSTTLTIAEESSVITVDRTTNGTDEPIEWEDCILGLWTVDMSTFAALMDKDITGYIIITFEESPENEITASFDITIPRKPPSENFKIHKGTLSATAVPYETLAPDSVNTRFQILNLVLDESNEHKRYKAYKDEWVDIRDQTKYYLETAVYYYKDCSPTMFIGMHSIKLDRY